MRYHLYSSALVAAALLLPAGPSFATEQKPASATTTDSTKAVVRSSKPANKKTPVESEIKLVDINNAGKTELMTLPGIKDAEAARIIAGRPYGSKAQLTTRGILPRDAYENLKRLVIARQGPVPALKSSQTQR